MTVINSRESMLSHEKPQYIRKRPRWVIGNIPDLSDYRKLSVDSLDEAFALARYGQEATSTFIPNYRGKPLLLNFTQAMLVGAALLTREQAEKLGLDFEKYRSVLMVTPTRFGKSFLNAIIAIIKAGVEGKEVRIGGATRDKAGIIQEKIVNLLPNAAKPIQDGLIVTEEEGDINKKVQRMATQVSKEALAWRNGGSIKLFSTNEARKNVEVAAAGAIGVGGDFVILDEIQLMTPMGFRTASRFMMENPDTKRFCVGNPQINGHFRDLYDDPETFVVHINDIGAIVEGRMSRKGIELTGIPTYSNEYRAFCEVEFPDERSGTRFFPTLPLPLNSSNLGTPIRKDCFIGIDSAYKGGDSLIVSVLSFNVGENDSKWIVLEDQIDLKKKYPDWTDETTMNIAIDILKIFQDTEASSMCIDIGFGIHIYEAIQRLDPSVGIEPVNFGEKPTEWRVESDFNARTAYNARAEMHLDLRDVCESGLLYVNDAVYEELARQMREVGTNTDNVTSKVKIEAKKDIRIRLGRSPDNLDSLCLALRALVHSGVLSDSGDFDATDLAEFY